MIRSVLQKSDYLVVINSSGDQWVQTLEPGAKVHSTGNTVMVQQGYSVHVLDEYGMVLDAFSVS